jgi:hypothetical protein
MNEQTHILPVEIVKAIIAITGKVRKLAKEGNNAFARYKFTSVDQFYEALGPMMAEHGLCDLAFERAISVETRETTNDKGETKKGVWMTAEYDFVLYHESGVMSEPIGRTITVQATGAQSYASAQSYAEKYFLRNLFKVPTGDRDEVDEAAQNGLPEGSVVSMNREKKISATQVQMIRTALDTLRDKGVEAVMLEAVAKKYPQVKALADIPANEVSGLMGKLAVKLDDQSKATLAEADRRMAEEGVE